MSGNKLFEVYDQVIEIIERGAVRDERLRISSLKVPAA